MSRLCTAASGFVGWRRGAPATVCESGRKCSCAVHNTLWVVGRCSAYNSSAAAKSQTKSNGAVPPATIQAPSGLTQNVRHMGWLLPGRAGPIFFSRARVLASHSQKLSSYANRGHVCSRQVLDLWCMLSRAEYIFRFWLVLSWNESYHAAI